MTRHAIEQTTEELKNFIINTALNRIEPNWAAEIRSYDKEEDQMYEIMQILQEEPQIIADLKWDISEENINIDPDNPFQTTIQGNHSLIGYHSFPTGLSFLGVQQGGDYEMPIFYIMYCDGKQLRAYIPMGNQLTLNDVRTHQTTWSDITKDILKNIQII